MKLDYRYLAGLFDGEGYVGLPKRFNTAKDRKAKTQKYGYSIMVNVTNAHKPTIEYLRSIFGGDIQPNNQNEGRTVWAWRIQGHNSKRFLKGILRYSRIKKPQIALALEYLSTYKFRHKKGLKKEQDAYNLKFKQLKKEVFSY